MSKHCGHRFSKQINIDAEISSSNISTNIKTCSYFLKDKSTNELYRSFIKSIHACVSSRSALYSKIKSTTSWFIFFFSGFMFIMQNPSIAMGHAICQIYFESLTKKVTKARLYKLLGWGETLSVLGSLLLYFYLRQYK